MTSCLLFVNHGLIETGSYLKEKNLLLGRKFFSLRVNPGYKGDKNIFDNVASPAYVYST